MHKIVARITELAKITFRSPYLATDIEAVRVKYSIPEAGFVDSEARLSWFFRLRVSSKSQLNSLKESKALDMLAGRVKKGEYFNTQLKHLEDTDLLKYWRDVVLIANRNSIPYKWLRSLQQYILGTPLSKLSFALPMPIRLEHSDQGALIGLNLYIDATTRSSDLSEIWAQQIKPLQKQMQAFTLERVGKQNMFDVGERIIELRSKHTGIDNKELAEKVSDEFDKIIQPYELDNYIRFVNDKYKILRTP